MSTKRNISRAAERPRTVFARVADSPRVGRCISANEDCLRSDLRTSLRASRLAPPAVEVICGRALQLWLAIATTTLVPSRAECEDAVSDSEKSSVVGSIEFGAGIWDSAFGVKFDAGRGFLTDESVSSTLGVVPAIEWTLGRTVFVGAELVLLWVDDPFWRLNQRRPLTGLNGRARLSFPVYGGFTADVVVGTGPAAWSSDPRDGTFYGWSRRMGFGSSYQLNDNLQPYFHISYYDVNSYSVEGTFDPQPIHTGQLIDVSIVLFSVGVRAGSSR